MKHLYVLILLFITACSPVVTPSLQTSSPDSLPTKLPEQSNTPIPTISSVPTSAADQEIKGFTLTPTVSGEESNASDLTPNPIVVLSGIGDDIVELDLPEDFVGVIHVIGNEIGGEFTIRNFDLDGELIGLLVQTDEPYDGIRPLDFLNTEDTGSLEIQGEGDWVIEIIDIFEAPFLDMPGNLTQSGDYVLVLGGGVPNSALVKKDEAIGNFRILGYGRSIEVLVDTTEPVEGVISINPDIVVLEIQAQGEWSLEVMPR